VIPALVVGTVLSVQVVDHASLPRTVVVLETAAGPVELVLPGSNGAPPVVVGGVPALRVGETWQAELHAAPVGLVPVGLGAGLDRLDGPPPPPWALNGLSYQEDQLPLRMFLNEAGSADLGLARTEELVLEALADWNGVACSAFAFEYGGLSEAVLEDDGQNVLTWQDEGEWEWGTAVAGFAATRFEPTEDGTSVRPAGADLLFNGVEWTWMDGEGDIGAWKLDSKSIILHELGHVTGMDHELRLVTSTMYYAYLGGTWQGSLSGDDRRGLCENYGNGLQECETDADCAAIAGAGSLCVELDGLRVCDEPREPIGGLCSKTDFNCEDYCVFELALSQEGYCTQACEAHDDCPEGYVCELGDNFMPDSVTLKELMCQPGERPVEDTGGGDGGGQAQPGDDPDEPEGCGCRASASPASMMPLLLLPLTLLRRRRPLSLGAPR